MDVPPSFSPSPKHRSGSHVAILLAHKYPKYKIVVLDKLDCKSCRFLRRRVLQSLPLCQKRCGCRARRDYARGTRRQSCHAVSQAFTHTPLQKPHTMQFNFLLPNLFHKQLDCASLDNLSEVNRRRNFKFVKGNICSSDLVNFVLEEEEIDTVLHLAAQTHVDNSFGNSFSFTQNNILGTHVLLESAKVHGIKRFVHCSTDEVYGEGTADQEPMFEDNVLEVGKNLLGKHCGKRRRCKPGIVCFEGGCLRYIYIGLVCV